MTLLGHTIIFSSLNPHEQRLLREYAAGDDALLAACIARREAREPLYHIIGSKGFWRDDFIVSPDVLTPRADSETLIEAIIDARSEKNPAYNILDLGTGSGCLLLSLLREYPQARGMGVDKSEAALNIAKENAEALGLSERCSWFSGDWNALPEATKADIIISNPPYICAADIDELEPEVREYEPHMALNGGESGLDAYQNLAMVLPRWLAHEGIACIELGINQLEPTQAIMEKTMRVMASRRDLGGIERALLLCQK